MASSVHLYLNWAKERIDEMNAVLASLEGRAVQVTAESQAKADELIADLHRKRNAFLENMKKRSKAKLPGWRRRQGWILEWDRLPSPTSRNMSITGPAVQAAADDLPGRGRRPAEGVARGGRQDPGGLSRTGS